MTEKARELTQRHMVLLGTLEKRFRNCSVENTGVPLIPDHMLREETCFVRRLLQFAGFEGGISLAV